MGSRLTEIVVDCHDPVAQAAFWAAALDYHVVRTEEGQVEIAPGSKNRLIWPSRCDRRPASRRLCS